MKQDERWLARYNEMKMFIETNRRNPSKHRNKRNPSKHRMEEHDILNWLKANRKLMNAGKMKPERIKMFEDLLALIEQYKRVNQYQ